MEKLRKNIFTICFEANETSKILYAAGTFFNVTEGNVSILTNPENGLKALEYALGNFTVTNEGLHFYYNLSSKSIMRIVESTSIDINEDKKSKSLISFNEIAELNEKLLDLESLQNEYRSAGNIKALKEATMISSGIVSQITNLKKDANFVLYKYVAEENKVYMNNREVFLNNLTEDAFASGLIEYSDKAILETFTFVAKHFNKYNVAENLVEVTDGDIKIATIRINEKAFVFRNNTSAKVTTLNEFSAPATIDYVAENTGIDISFMFKDVLEGQISLKERINQRIEENYELISFLKDQRNILAESNKNIPEIKEADILINSEIKRLERNTNILESDELTRNDGFINGVLLVDSEGIMKGTEVKVDALDYTTSSEEDMVSIVNGEEILKVSKRSIEISPKETI